MMLTINQIIEAMKAGHQVEVVINGEYYDIDENATGDKRVTRKEFLKLYGEELDKHFAEIDAGMDDHTTHIYGYPVTVHWNGIYCDCEDGAVPYNNIIQGVSACDEELWEELDEE